MTICSFPPQTATLSLEQELGQTVNQALQLAANRYKSGQIQDAEDLYRAILKSQPNQPDANHNLGLLEVQAQRPAAGLPYFEIALEALPEQEQYWISYIDALIQAGQTEIARQVLELGRRHGLQGDAVERLAGRLQAQSKAAQPLKAPKSGTSKKKKVPHKPLGRTPSAGEMNTVVGLYGQRRTTEVETLARSLTMRFPLHGFGWKMLGAALQTQARGENALLCMQKAVRLLPGDAETHSILGVTLKDQGRLSESEASLRRALAIKPDFAEAHNNLGIVLRAQGQLLEAEASLHRALALKPDYAGGHSNLGLILGDQGRLIEAEASLRRALALMPDYVETHSNLGITLLGQGRLAEAETSLRRALALKPNDAEAHNNMGVILQGQGRLLYAEASLRRAVEFNPNYADAHSNLGNVLQEQSRLAEATESYRRALAVKADYAGGHSNLLFCLSQTEGIDAGALFAEHCRFGDQFEGPLRSHWPAHSNLRDPERCLQIGFVSADFRNHAVASFIEPVLVHLAGYKKLSLHAYYNHSTDDSVTQRLRGYLTHWHSVVGLSDAAMAEKIRADGIDILIDLSGHTGHNRLPTFAYKPAPIQVSWLGYPGTTGLQAMDYYLCDRFFIPPGEIDWQFTEKTAYLPAVITFKPFDHSPPVNTLPALGNGYITFGSFNRASKLNDSVIALWSMLLSAVPDARMVLVGIPLDIQAALTQNFFRHGIQAHQLKFYPRSNMQDYLLLHHQVDICLDTFPYGGGTTTLHASWMAVPTLTWAGETPPGRSGASLMNHLGLTKFIAKSIEDFVAKGIYWSKNIAELATLRLEMRARFNASAIGQPERFANSFEAILRTMWLRWCNGLPPASIETATSEFETCTQAHTNYEKPD